MRITDNVPSITRAFKGRLRFVAPMLLALLFAGTVYTTYGSSVASADVAALDSAIKPGRTCDSLKTVPINDSTDNVQFSVQSAVTDPGNSTLPPSCRATVVATHPPAGDQENIWIWLPTNGWNGRFQGTGGGGYVGGTQSALEQPLSQGYATGATDAGHTVSGGSYALNADGTLNWQLIEDNVLGVHEMTVAGKTLTTAFYSHSAKYSYFTGCSAGARQGITEARQYPNDYDGVLGGSPAINVTIQRVVGLYGEMLMNNAGDFIPSCKFDAATTAAVQACDTLDGVQDGVINDPRDCHFDPATLVGTNTPCGTITQTDAGIIKKIWDGARDTQGNFLWYGLSRGANLAALDGTGMVNGQLDGLPSSLMTDWVKYFLTQHPNWDWHTLTLPQFEQFLTQSEDEYGIVLNDGADLQSFNKSGGKMLLWQGWSDQLLAPQGMISYYNKVTDISGGQKKTQDYARLFMAPGVGHCGGGAGPQPTGTLQALQNWVEHGKAPDTILAQKTDAGGNVTQTRPLCAYPAEAVYKGHGDTNNAANFKCKQV